MTTTQVISDLFAWCHPIIFQEIKTEDTENVITPDDVNAAYAENVLKQEADNTKNGEIVLADKGGVKILYSNKVQQ